MSIWRPRGRPRRRRRGAESHGAGLVLRVLDRLQRRGGAVSLLDPGRRALRRLDLAKAESVAAGCAAGCRAGCAAGTILFSTVSAVYALSNIFFGASSHMNFWGFLLIEKNVQGSLLIELWLSAHFAGRSGSGFRQSCTSWRSRPCSVTRFCRILMQFYRNFADKFRK